jgi:hypothetical protein
MAFSLAETFAKFLKDPSELLEDEINGDLSEPLENLIDKLAVSSQSIVDDEPFNTSMQILW